MSPPAFTGEEKCLGQGKQGKSSCDKDILISTSISLSENIEVYNVLAIILSFRANF